MGRSALLAALALATAAPDLTAHEIPARVVVRAFVKPEPGAIRVLIRVPLEAFRDIDFPIRGAGYLDLAAVTPRLAPAVMQWVANYLRIEEAGTPTAPPVVSIVRISLPSDRSFGSFAEADGQLRAAPLDSTVELPWRQALLDAELRYPIRAATSDFAIVPELAHLGVRTTTVLHFLTAAGAERLFEFTGNPGRIRLDPGWWNAAARFVGSGFAHILDGIDHLLFLIGLILPLRSFWRLVPVVTAFTVAHSITLIASVLGLAPDALWFPPLVETLIAASVVLMAIENVVGARTERRWMLAFGFGLVHGFGFAFALRETLQFAGAHLATALVAFNLGVELGQLLVVALAIPVLDLLFRRVLPERIGTIVIAVLVGHTAWHWMMDRGAVLADYSFTWPTFDAGFAAAVLRLLMLLAIAAGAAALLHGGFARLQRRHPESSGGVPLTG